MPSRKFRNCVVVTSERNRRETPKQGSQSIENALCLKAARFAEDGIVKPDEYEQLDDHLRPLVHRFGVVHLAGLEEFGNRVSEQLWQAIKAEHKLPDTPPAVTLAETDPLAEEAAYHEEFMESRLRFYVDRQEVQDRLMAYAEGDATHRGYEEVLLGRLRGLGVEVDPDGKRGWFERLVEYVIEGNVLGA